MISLEELRKRSVYINEQQHPELPLLLFNYNQKCQFERAWDFFTLISRGLITDLSGKVIARGFRKFFNLNEVEETKIENLPVKIPNIYEKLDGSLGIQYYNGDQVCIATRGSFMSEQAQWATQWIRARYKRSDFIPGYSYLYEIIYPQNRIVINYGDRAELVLLAIIHNETGDEFPIEPEAIRLGLSKPKRIYDHLDSLIRSMDKLDGSSEGFVVQYPGGLRVKMKGSEYVRLHRLITGFSTKSIWECLMNGQDIEQLLEKVPDEFYQWVKEKRQQLFNQFTHLWGQAQMQVQLVQNKKSRKDQAIEILKKHKRLASVIFSLLDSEEKKAAHQLWRMLKPKYELPFRTDIDQ